MREHLPASVRGKRSFPKLRTAEPDANPTWGTLTIQRFRNGYNTWGRTAHACVGSLFI